MPLLDHNGNALWSVKWLDAHLNAVLELADSIKPRPKLNGQVLRLAVHHQCRYSGSFSVFISHLRLLIEAERLRIP